jgi:hypothetical protein
MSQDKIGFVTGSVRGRQKLKLNVRRFLRTLPAHKRLDKFEKLYRKRGFQKKAIEDND